MNGSAIFALELSVVPVHPVGRWINWFTHSGIEGLEILTRRALPTLAFWQTYLHLLREDKAFSGEDFLVYKRSRWTPNYWH